MEIERVPQEQDEGRTAKKKPKTFSQKTSILLLLLTLVFSVGTGYALGHFYFWNDIDMKRVNEQLAFYKEEVRKDPTNLQNRIILGYTYYLKGDNDEAIKQYDYVLEQDKNYYDAHYNMGLVYVKEERYNEALIAFEKCVKIAPKDFKGYVQMGIAYRGLKEYDKATKALEQANKMAPTNADIIYQIGMVAEAQGQYDDAIAIYKDALQYDPLYKDAVAALDRLKDKDTVAEGEKQ
ncbi:tetratricopeptide repeat protein [Neobacillus sp. GCM10023253]|uniref:tetratricopeptide repeat protein n=1 Tax=Neobacillus sp. GCM10023253 TaxID=3252644 RepID=UPI00361697D2